ncbi:hypothetical protein LCGC14_0509420 [marine sediment metagenome]|uniref:Nuclease associated modular domain-containing protein n=1 Tax=marine sediment metagenome TaxID=412755 RepID=A0A0F9UN97_9ZZZZ|nr:DUF559 domain-containing protein [bacterium]
MMNKKYKQTKEHKKKIGLANAIKMKEYWKSGRATELQIMRGYYNRNKKRELGYINSLETRKKLSDVMKKRFEEGKFNPKDISPFIKGHKKGMFGKKHTKETKEKMSKSSKGFTEYARIKSKEKRKYQVIPIKDTSIEVKIQNFLKQLGIDFFTHQYMKEIKHGYQCDILIPSMNLIIECDGDYWHKYPIGNNLDHIRTKELIENGFKVLRLWEHEIKVMELNDFKGVLYKR